MQPLKQGQSRGPHQNMNLFFPFLSVYFCNLLVRSRSRSCRSCLLHPIYILHFGICQCIFFIRNKPIGKGQINIKSGRGGALLPDHQPQCLLNRLSCRILCKLYGPPYHSHVH